MPVLAVVERHCQLDNLLDPHVAYVLNVCEGRMDTSYTRWIRVPVRDLGM